VIAFVGAVGNAEQNYIAFVPLNRVQVFDKDWFQRVIRRKCPLDIGVLRMFCVEQIFDQNLLF